MSEQRVLPADVYDTLELSALVYGGIGGAEMFERDDSTVPICLMGHAGAAQNTCWAYDSPMWQAIHKAGVGVTANDYAVRTINTRRGRPPYARVPFKAWTKELRIVRGD